MGPLCDLQEKNGVKMGERYRNDKKAKEFIYSIADVETARIADQVASARFISVLSDGSTDNSITEQEAVYVRYVYNGQVYTRLANIVALSSANADGIEAGIYEALHSVGLGREQIRNKLTCINLDEASVNQGKKGGVAKKKIKDDIPHAVVSTWCINHKLEFWMPWSPPPLDLILSAWWKKLWKLYSVSTTPVPKGDVGLQQLQRS